MQIDHLDHLVLTVRDIEATSDFYTRVLGMEPVSFGGGRRALLFGSQKINLHAQGKELEPRAQQPTPGSADLCFISPTPLAEIIEHLATCGVEIIEGPVERSGATGLMMSIYFRDPDMNLIEVGNVLD